MEENPRRRFQIPWEIVRMGKELSCEAFRVYCVIESYNPSFPSYAKIEKDTGLSRPCVAKKIKELEKLNLISYAKGNSLRKSNVYRVLQPTSKPGELVNDVNQLTSLTRTSKRRLLELVNDVNSKSVNTNQKNINQKSDGKLRCAIIPFIATNFVEVNRFLKIIKNESQKNWVNTYGHDYILKQLLKMEDWLIRNPNRKFHGKTTAKSAAQFFANWLQRDWRNNKPAENMKIEAENLFKKIISIGRHSSLQDKLTEWEYQVVQNLPEGGSLMIFNCHPQYQFKIINIIRETMENIKTA